MMRSEAGRGGRRWGVLAAALIAASCATQPASVETRPPTAVERKQTMLLATERAIHVIFEDARADLARIEAQFAAETKGAPACYSLASAEPGLESFGSSRRKERSALVATAESRRQQQLKLLVEHYEAAFWAVATDAGKRETGKALGTRTGYAELDQKVDAAVLQLAGEADLDGAAQDAEAASSDHVGLERQIRHELPGIGILSLYKSQPIRGLIGPDDEGQAAAFVFARAKPDAFALGATDAAAPVAPPAAPSFDVSFVQAVRRRVERGGLLIASTDWQLDPAAADRRGTLPLSPEVEASTHTASALLLPLVDKSDPSFRELWDHVLIAEFRTAMRRDDTGELLAVVGWQVRWNIDWAGRMRVLVDPDDQVLPNDPVLPRLLGGATGG